MNHSLRSAWHLLLLLLPLLALKCKKDDIAKVNQFAVTVRATGEHLDGLGAEIQVDSRLNVLNPSAGPSLTHSYPTNVSQTYLLGTFGLQDDVTITVAFRNVTCTSTVRPASNSRLKIELLANGVAVNTLELTPAPRGGSFSCSPYWLDTTVGSGSDWD